MCNMLRRTLWVRWSSYLHIQCVLSCFSRVQLFATPWSVACQALCPWGFPDSNVGVSCYAFSGGSNPGIKLISLMSPALAGWFFTTSAIWEAPIYRRGLEKVHQLTWARSGVSPDILTWEPVLLTSKLSIFFFLSHIVILNFETVVTF